MNKSLLAVGLSLALAVPLCAQAGDKEEFQKIYSEAKSVNEDAGNFQWTVTFSKLKAADAAAGKGDYEKAKTMATQALELARESVRQRKEQAEAWKTSAIGS